MTRPYTTSRPRPEPAKGGAERDIYTPLPKEWGHGDGEYAGGVLTLVLPKPPRELMPNGRVHWRAKARLTKAHRQYAQVAALAALKGERPEWRRAVAQVVWYSPQAARLDGDNCLSAAKSYFDGLADAGVVANDRGITHLPVQIVKDSETRVVIAVREDN